MRRELDQEQFVQGLETLVRLTTKSAIESHPDQCPEEGLADTKVATYPRDELEEDINPYELGDADPAAKLQMTTRATRDWIHANCVTLLR